MKLRMRALVDYYETSVDVCMGIAEASSIVACIAMLFLLMTSGLHAAVLTVVTIEQAEPGQTDVRVQMGLLNDLPYYGIEMQIVYDDERLSLTRIEGAGRLQSFSDVVFYEYAPGQVSLVVFDAEAAELDTGDGAVLHLYFDILSDAAGGLAFLAVVDVVVVTSTMEYDDVEVVDGGIVRVLLAGFTAASTSESVILNWTTLHPVSGFILDRRVEENGSAWGRVTEPPVRNSSSPEGFDYFYEDAEVSPGVTYEYRLLTFDDEEPGDILGYVTVTYEGNIPAALGLSHNYPNPFNPITKFNISVPAKQDIAVEIFDIAGRRVRTLHHGAIDAGYHTLSWDGRSSQGNAVASGVYFCRMVAGEFERSTKVMLLK